MRLLPPRHLSFLLASVLVTTVVGTGLAAAPAARADVTTNGAGPLRNGWHADQPALTPSAVQSSSFGSLFSTPVDGQVYAQPLVVKNTVVAVTENNQAYGIDPRTGAKRWTTDLGEPWPASTLQCGDLVPNIGVTSTPVYNPATNSVVMLSKTIPVGSDAQRPQWYVHALDPASGQERAGYPYAISGSPTNDPGRPFLPLTAMQRPGLLLLNGVVYAGFASHCDSGPYVGYVVGLGTKPGTTKPGVRTIWATETGNVNGEGGVWQSGSGLASDGPGQILIATGNGISPQPGRGKIPPGTLGESVVRLTVQPDGSLAAKDFFSPANNARLDQDDADLGSAGPIVIPDGYGTPAVPRLLVQSGKDGRIQLLNRDNLGGMGQAPGGGDATVNTSGPYRPIYGRAAFFGGNGGYVYTVEANGYLRAHKLDTATGTPRLTSVGTSTSTFGFASGSPTVTSNGTDPASALVWVLYKPPGSGPGGQLRAYSAIPTNGVLALRYTYDIGLTTKFSTIAVDNGRIYLGTRDGTVRGFGIPTTASLTSPVTDFGQVVVGASVSKTVRVTAVRPVTVTSASATAPYSVPPTAFSLTTGQTKEITISVTPDVPGSISDSLTLVTSTGERIALPLQVTGTRTGVTATPALVDFETVPVGTAREFSVSFANSGTTPWTVTGTSLSGGSSLSALNLPAAGRVVQPQTSLTVSLLWQPVAAGPLGGRLTLRTSAGGAYANAEVRAEGTAVVGSTRMVLPKTFSLGDVAVGLSTTRSFDITNDGNIPLTITKAKAPAGVFTSDNPLPEGLTIPPGDTLHQAVTFTPTAIGPAIPETYLVTSTDGRGAQLVTLTGNGIGDPIAVKYASLGGASLTSLLGNPITPQFDIPGGRGQQFQRGYIYWTPATGAHEIHGLIAKRYGLEGAVASPLGIPISDELVTPDGGGRYVQFSGGGAIYWTPVTGAQAVYGAIYAKWAATGWEAGPLGYPTSSEQTAGGGRFNDFQGASIYWSPASGAHSIQGAIRARWLGLGGAAGRIGYPLVDETPTPDGVGRFTLFTGDASIYWTPQTGANAIMGAIRARWAALGWETGPLGYPVTDETDTPDGAGRYNDFSGAGSIVWSPASGAWSIRGAIRAHWLALGREAGPIGYPVTDELGTPDGVGRFNLFSKGASIYWTPQNGAWSIRGAIRDHWAALGWETGPLGYPVTDELVTPDGVGRYNHFSRGASIYWTPQTAAWGVYGAIRAAWAAGGWETGPLGYPVTDEYAVPGGRESAFQRGRLTYSFATGQVSSGPR